MHMHISLFDFKATTTNLGFVDSRLPLDVADMYTDSIRE